MSTKKVISNNIDAKNRTVSSVINQRYNQSALDAVRNRLSKIKEREAVRSAIEDGQLAGILLWERTIPFTVFEAKYSNNISFYREITEKGKLGGPAFFVREAWVHIPEMTLMLPYPDFGIVNEYFQSLKSVKNNVDANSDSHLELQKKCKKEFEKIIMYPKFFQVATSVLDPLSVSYNSPCLVRSMNKNGLMTESVGKFIETIGV